MVKGFQSSKAPQAGHWLLTTTLLSHDLFSTHTPRTCCSLPKRTAPCLLHPYSGACYLYRLPRFALEKDRPSLHRVIGTSPC